MLITKKIMTSTEVLHQLKDLKEAWKKQNFVYSSTQQIKYNNLVEKRRDNIKFYYKNNLVYKATANK